MFHEEYDEEDYEEYEPPQPKRRASRAYDLQTERLPVPRQTIAPPTRRLKKRSRNLLTPFGVGMLLVVLVFVLWNMVVMPWWHGLEVQWHYGDQRVSVFGADVGHGGVSRFIAFEDGEEIVVVEVVAKKYTVYTIALTAQPNQLITLSVSDVNGDGKPDLIVHVDNQAGSFALLNTGSGFAASK